MTASGRAAGPGAGPCGAVRPVVSAAQDPARGRHCRLAAGAGHHRGALTVHLRADDSDAQDTGSPAGPVGADPTARAGATPADLGQRAGIDRGAEGVTSFMEAPGTKLVLLPPNDPEHPLSERRTARGSQTRAHHRARQHTGRARRARCQPAVAQRCTRTGIRGLGRPRVDTFGRAL